MPLRRLVSMGCSAAAAALLAVPAEAARLGGPFQVNTYTTHNQLGPAVAFDGSGNFIVAWTDGARDGDNAGIFAQRFTAGGVRIGGEFQVNQMTTSRQFSTGISMNASGQFVVVWYDQSSPKPEKHWG